MESLFLEAGKEGTMVRLTAEMEYQVEYVKNEN